MMWFLRLIFLPLRLLWFAYVRLRNLRRPGSVLFHRLPDRFTMVRPAGFFAFFLPRQETHFLEYLGFLRLLQESPTLRHLVYTVPDLEQASWTEVAEIGRCLETLSHQNIQLTAYTEGGGLKSLYLMSYAGRRLAAPHASFSFLLPALDGYFVKDTLAKFGVAVETYTAGKHKGESYEMFTRNGFSPAARKNLQELTGDFRKHIEERLGAARNLETSAQKKLSKLIGGQILGESADLKTAGYFDDLVQASRLQDFVLTGDHPDWSHDVQHGYAPDQAQDTSNEEAEPTPEEARRTLKELQQQLKHKVRASKKLTNESALYNYWRRSRYNPLRIRSLPSLAFVTLEGPIVTGRPGDPHRSHNIAALNLRDLFYNLADSREEAVIVYINSPGGSADASELLFESIYTLSRVKPVIAVVGTVAASGGYYLACAANRIYASPFSIVGSIGVIRVRPNIGGLYKKLGVKREDLGKQPTRELLSEVGRYGPAAQRLLKHSLKVTYDLFLNRVALGRATTAKEVQRMAEGRIFAGQRFADAGMIDGCAGFYDVVAEYRRMSGYREDQEFAMNFYPEIKADARTLIAPAGLPFGASAAVRSLVPEPARNVADLVEDLTAGDAGSRLYSPVARLLGRW